MVDFEDDIKNCVAAVKAGGVILYPTDTVWGLGCDALNEQAVDKVFAVKHRPANDCLACRCPRNFTICCCAPP